MSAMNMAGVIKGGLLAGVIINVGEGILSGVILAEEMQAVASRLAVPETPGVLAMYVVLGFGLGLMALWLYASIRPRFGPGPKTAVLAGLAVWLLSWGTGLAMSSALRLYSTSSMTLSLVWGAVEMSLATVVGAWLYKEA